MSIGQSIKAFRDNHNFTQAEFGEFVNLDRSTISHYERETSEPSEKTEKVIRNFIDKYNDTFYKFSDVKLKSVNLKNWRNFHNFKFELSNNITVISGHNGSGKSNILCLIASMSGTNIFHSQIYSDFHPDFENYFFIEPSELDKNYEVFFDYNFVHKDTNLNDFNITRGLRLKDDRKSKRGIRVLPRTYKETTDYLKKDYINDVFNKTGISDSARVPLPTIFSSLSRIVPIAESSPISQSFNIGEDLIDKYISWYNEVLFSSIKSNASNSLKITKEKVKNKSMYVEHNNASYKTQSVGQDNLGQIITSLVSFYNLSKHPYYIGGILCIDEIDVSLHPKAQKNLINLLDRLSKELNLQIILTTHSLTIIKEILELSSSNPENYRLIYIKNPSRPIMEINPDPVKLAQDMNENFSSEKKGKIKLYFEDESGLNLFNILNNTFKELSHNNIIKDNSIYDYYIEKNSVDLINAKMGCDTIRNLIKCDSYFENICFILDGDARISNNSKSQKKSYTYNHDIINDFDILGSNMELSKYPDETIVNYITFEQLQYYIENNNNIPDYNFTYFKDILKKENYDMSKINFKELKKIFKISNNIDSFNVTYFPDFIPPEMFLFKVLYQCCIGEPYLNNNQYLEIWKNIKNYYPDKIIKAIYEFSDFKINMNEISSLNKNKTYKHKIIIDDVKNKKVSDFILEIFQNSNLLYYYYFYNETKLKELIQFFKNMNLIITKIKTQKII